MEDLQWLYIAAGRIVLAAVCGAVIGYERELQEKGAGLRTHMLIGIGSCLFSLVAISMHKDFPQGDVIRLLQGMLLGVGFLAGGVIFTHRGSVRGLTTAAGLWVLTAVGMCAGLGYYFLAIFATSLTIIIIAWLRTVENWLHSAHTREDNPPNGE